MKRRKIPLGAPRTAEERSTGRRDRFDIPADLRAEAEELFVTDFEQLFQVAGVSAPEARKRARKAAGFALDFVAGLADVWRRREGLGQYDGTASGGADPDEPTQAETGG